MRFGTRPEQKALLRAAMKLVSDDEAAIQEHDRQAVQDKRDYEAWRNGALIRSRSFHPRNPASAQQLSLDRAAEQIWQHHIDSLPRRREALQHQAKLHLRDLIWKLAEIQDYYEQKFQPIESLEMMGPEAVLATCEFCLRHRFPEHPEPVEVAASQDRHELRRIFDLLLQHATVEEPEPEPETVAQP